MFLFILLSFSCTKFASRSPADKAFEKHMVFDIDWTIASEIKNPTATNLKNKRVIEVEGEHYYISDGLEEFVEDILTKKDVRISFYSGGKDSRNMQLLSKIKLKNGKSLFDISYKVLGNSDLSVIADAPSGARFSERYRKDLTKISKDLEQLIMLDDTANFVVENSDNQNNHVFFIGKAFLYFEKYSDAEGEIGEYVPKSYEQWLLHRNKMRLMHALFDEAYAESAETGVSFSEAMKKREELLNLKENNWNEYSNRLYKENQKVPVRDITLSGPDCRSQIIPFFN